MKKFEVLPSIITLSILLLLDDVRAQEKPNRMQEAVHPIHPSAAVIVAMLAAMFSVMFIILAYAKFCHGAPSYRRNQSMVNFRSNSRFSGIDRKVVESLPFFRFSSLRGSKEGLECVVCLSKFEDSETLRLLPNCNHAFHMTCIDKWLDIHSSCPLCRRKLDAKEISNFAYSMSLRFSRNPSNLSTEDVNDNLELYIQREEDRHGSSRYNNGSSFRLVEHDKREEELLVGDPIENFRGDYDARMIYHKFKHKIIVSDVVIKNRWSDVNSSDLLYLNSEMLSESSSKRFSEPICGAKLTAYQQMSKIKEDMGRKRLHENVIGKINTSDQSFVSNSSYDCSSSFEDSHPRIADSAGKRSKSEIINLSRFASSLKVRGKESPVGGNDERIRRLWLPIARRTVQWLAGRERSSDDPMAGDQIHRLNV